MGLARVWRRRLYASVGLAVVLPAALMISLALLALGGGSFSLASLKQLVSGPAAPSGQPIALGAPSRSFGGHGRSGSATATVVASVAAPVSSPGQGSRLSRPGGGNTVGGGGTGGGSGSGGGGSGSGGGRGGGSGGGGGGGHSGGGGGGGGGPRPPKPPTVVDRVVNTVTPVTSKLPVAGPLVTQVVKSAGSVADQILKKLPGK